MTDHADISRRLAPEQLDILRHALGVGRGRTGWRNHFVTGPGSDDYDHCEALVVSGLMVKRPGHPLTGGDPVYHVTDDGKAVIGGARVPRVEP